MQHGAIEEETGTNGSALEWSHALFTPHSTKRCVRTFHVTS